MPQPESQLHGQVGGQSSGPVKRQSQRRHPPGLKPFLYADYAERMINSFSGDRGGEMLLRQVGLHPEEGGGAECHMCHLSLAEIGRRNGLTRERVRQVVFIALSDNARKSQDSIIRDLRTYFNAIRNSCGSILMEELIEEMRITSPASLIASLGSENAMYRLCKIIGVPSKTVGRRKLLGNNVEIAKQRVASRRRSASSGETKKLSSAIPDWVFSVFSEMGESRHISAHQTMMEHLSGEGRSGLMAFCCQGGDKARSVVRIDWRAVKSGGWRMITLRLPVKMADMIHATARSTRVPKSSLIASMLIGKAKARVESIA